MLGALGASSACGQSGTQVRFPAMKLSTALKHYKTEGAIARALNIKHQAVAQWKAKGRVPLARALELEQLTKGAIKVDTSVYARDPLPAPPRRRTAGARAAD